MITQSHLCCLAILFLALSNSANAQQRGTLVWSDEFNGPAGSPIDGTKWVFDTGGEGWGNKELEYYTTSPSNAAMDGAGNLMITAIKEAVPTNHRCWYGPCQYTSARIKTKGKFEQKYGRFEARIKIPSGQGLWPAFWLLGNNIDSVGWPNCGEIDIMENIGKEPAIVHATLHGRGFSSAGIGAGYSLSTGAFREDFHTFAIEWQPNVIRTYVDDNLYQTRTPKDLSSGAVWAFDHPYFILLNVAVGGEWPGNPDSATEFPQKMYVDYVRVYRN